MERQDMKQSMSIPSPNSGVYLHTLSQSTLNSNNQQININVYKLQITYLFTKNQSSSQIKNKHVQNVQTKNLN